MKYTILFSIIFALSIVAVSQSAFADECDGPRCYSQIQSNAIEIEGMQYELDSPDLYIDRSCDDNVAVSTGWYEGTNFDQPEPEWFEAGIKRGIINDICESTTQAYYAIWDYDPNFSRYDVIEYAFERVDPGENITVVMQTVGDNIQTLVTSNYFVDYPFSYSLHPDNQYYAKIGIEGSVSADKDHSTIPMSKFTNVQTKVIGVWNSMDSPIDQLNDYSAEGYIGEQCSADSFVMGSVMDTDCSVAATNNQIPDGGNYNFDVPVPSTVTVDLDDVDGDFDYLKYTITGLPSYGIATNSTFGALTLGDRIPEVDGDSATFDYTATSNPTHDDTIRYTVTDGRTGHTIENVVFMDGVVYTPIAPDIIDDFSYIVIDTTITFDWTEPNDNGSPISFYTIEESDDAESWTQYAIVSGAPFNFLESYGYQQYFRIFATNVAGLSPSSNVLDVYVPDDIPPTVTIIEPTDTEFEENDFIEFIGSAIDDVDGPISELIGWSSDIDGFLGTGESIRINTLSLNTHIITAFAEDMARNSDTDTITITIIIPTTSVPDKITNLNAIFSDDDLDIILTWDIPNNNESPLEVYIIESRIEGDVSWRADYITDTEITTFSFHGILGTTYEFQVSARNGVGYGETSDIVTAYMPDYDPPFPSIYEPDNGDTVGKFFIADGFVFDLDTIQSFEIQIGSDVPVSIPIQQYWVTEVIAQTNGPQTLTVTVTNLDNYTRSSSVDIIVDFEAQETLDRFYDDFEFDLSEWENTGQELWEIKTPDVIQIPGFPNTNNVASSDNCDNYCILSMVDAVDLTGHVEPYLSFYRFVDDDADFTTLTALPDPDDEGLILYYSDDDGNTWQIIDSWLKSQGKADGIWQLAEYSLDEYSGADNFKIRFIAISSASSEDMEIDEVFIRDNAEPVNTEPDAPTNLNAIAGDTQVTLSWTAPADDGGDTITDYIISYKLNATLSFTIFDDGTTNSTTATVTSLTNDSLYNFIVNATNSIGTGPASNVASATTIFVNTAPILDPIGNQTTDELVQLSFNATATDADDDPLTFSLTNGTSGIIPTGAAITTDGLFTWTPAESQDGTHTFDVIVTDGVLSDSETITVTVNDVSIPGDLLFTITNPLSETDDNFGKSIATTFDGNVVIGLRYNDVDGINAAGSVGIFNGTTGELQLLIDNPVPEPNDNFGSDVDVTPDGNILVSAVDGYNGLGKVHLFNGITGELLLSLEEHTEVSNNGDNLAVTPDGNIVIGSVYDDTGAGDAGSVYLFNGTSGELLLTIHNPTPNTSGLFGSSVASTSSGDLLISTGGTDEINAVYLFNGTSGEQLLTIHNPDDSMWRPSIAITPDDNFVIGDKYNQFIYLFNGTTGEMIFTIQSPDDYNSIHLGWDIAITPDGNIFASTEFHEQPESYENGIGLAHLFNGTTGELLLTIESPDSTIAPARPQTAILPDGKLVVSIPYDNYLSMPPPETPFLGEVYVFEGIPYLEIDTIPDDPIPNSVFVQRTIDIASFRNADRSN